MAARGKSLRGLCREAGLDPSFFSKVLAGKRSPPSEEAALRRLARVLEVDAAELIVSAGRIPADWGALWRDPEVFREVRRVVAASNESGKRRAPGMDAGRGQGAVLGDSAKVSPRVSPPASGGGLAEELL